MTTLTFQSSTSYSPIDLSAYFDVMKKSEMEMKKSEMDVALRELRDDIGEALFMALSEEDKMFILKTEGIVNLGHNADLSVLKKIFSSIKDEYRY